MSSYRIDELSVDQLDRISLPKFPTRGLFGQKKKQEDFRADPARSVPLWYFTCLSGER